MVNRRNVNPTPVEEAAGAELNSNLKAPGLLRMVLEGRAPWEFGATLAAYSIVNLAPCGDGHPVLVFPGLAAGDFTTVVMRNFLKSRGYASQAWEQGLNLGPRPGVVEACIARVRQLQAEHGRNVSFIGWSLGGIYAREIAKMVPDVVRQVISLGTPFAENPRATNAWRLYQLVSGERMPDQARIAELKKTPAVPTTSIFSRTDGIVPWQCSIEKETARSENIEVFASHVGMGMNPAALYAIADRLAQPEGAWQRFDRAGHSGVKKYLFRDPHRGPPVDSWFGLY